MPSTGPHYFDEELAAGTPSNPRDVDLWLADGHLTLRTDHGVFGYGQVDAGTKLLLGKVPAPPSRGDLVDLGCGTGAIALTMARRAPEAAVWAVDVNPRARQLCAHNAASNGLTNVHVVHPDEFADRPIDGLWSNPPIRVGKAALHAMLTRWLGLLRPDAAAWLVVHKHLGSDSLQRWLEGHGLPTSRQASSSGYRVLCVSARRVDHDAQPGA